MKWKIIKAIAENKIGKMYNIDQVRILCDLVFTKISTNKEKYLVDKR